MPQFWIDIQDNLGDKYGDGPITTASSWDQQAKLDRAGSFKFTMPASDPRAALLVEKREAWCYTILDGEVTLIGAGIIDRIETDPASLTLTVSGLDLLGQLSNLSVGYLEIEDSGAASPDALEDIMDEAPVGWSLDTVDGYDSTEDDVYAKFVGESVLSALIKMADHKGEHFRLGAGKKVVWLRQDLTDSGIRAIQTRDPDSAKDSNTCLIKSLKQTRDSYDLISRIYGFGAGNGQARVSLADSTISAHAGYVIDKSNVKGPNLTHSAAQTTYGTIERFMSWKEFNPISNTEADIESAANALYGAMYQYLSRFSQINYSYSLEVADLDQIVYPGQRIRVVFHEFVDAYHAINIDTDLTILETTTRLDSEGIRTVAMQVSTIDAWPHSLEEILMGQMEEARLMDGHPQTFAGYYSEGLGHYNVNTTYSAIARFKFDDRITRLVSAVVRFRTDAFESTAAGASSGGGSAPVSNSKTVTIASNQNTGSHRHGIDIGAADPAFLTNYKPLYIHKNDGDIKASSSESISGFDKQTAESQGTHNHTITLNGHNHTVTINPHDHDLVYDVDRDTTYPGNITIWVNGENKTFELTGQTSIGTTTGSTGVVELELADILNTDLRGEHTVELKIGAGKGRILNMALRCFVIVQAIFVQPVIGAPSPSTPAEPTVNCIATADGFYLTWLPIIGAESYRIYGNTAGTDAGANEITITTATELTVPYVSGYTWFAGTAIAGVEESDIGPWATDATAPVSPVWMSHLFQLAGHYLTWSQQNAIGIEEFTLYQNDSASLTGASTLAILPGTQTDYLAGYVAGDYYFGIKATGYNGIDSGVIWCGPFDPTPDDVGVAVEMITPGFVVGWTAAAGALVYEVEGADDDSGTNSELVFSGNTLSSPPQNQAGQIYFRVRALGYGDIPGNWSAWTTDTNPPAAPLADFYDTPGFANIAINNLDTSHLSPGFSHYIVEIADDGSGTNAATLDSARPYAGFPYQIPQLPFTTKYYRLTPVDLAGNEGDDTGWQPISVSTDETGIVDKFDSYGSETPSDLETLDWLTLAGFESDESWTIDTTAFGDAFDIVTSTGKGGEGALVLASQPLPTGATEYFASLTVDLDLSNDSRWTDDDYISFLIQFFNMADNNHDVSITLADSGGNTAKGTKTIDAPTDDTTAYRYYFQKSDLTITGSLDWSDITTIKIGIKNNTGSPSNNTFYIDDIRIARESTSEAGVSNDTGDVWKNSHTHDDAPPGIWNVIPGNRSGEPPKPFSYAQLQPYQTITLDPSPAHYISYRDDKSLITGTVQAGIYIPDSGAAAAGLAFFVKDVTSGSYEYDTDEWSYGHWEMYVLRLRVNGSNISYRMYGLVDGEPVYISAEKSFPAQFAQTLWVGVDFREYISDNGRIKVHLSYNEGNIIQAETLVMAFQDDTFLSDPGGHVGLVSFYGDSRFIDFRAGSPAHAEFSDISGALDGPVIVEKDVRMWLRPYQQSLEKSDDSKNYHEILNTSSLISKLQSQPGLVGLWPMSSIQRSTGNVYDLSGQGRTLTYNGNPTFGLYNDLVPYIQFDGTGDFLRRTDETDLDIIGSESWAELPGLTLGGWFYFDRTGVNEGLISKWASSGSQASYDILRVTGGACLFRITTNGSTSVGVASAVLPVDTWHFIVGVFTPSTSSKIFVNGTWVTNTTSIPATIHSGTANFIIGGTENGAALMQGKASMCFLCANALPDAMIEKDWQQGRLLLGV